MPALLLRTSLAILAKRHPTIPPLTRRAASTNSSSPTTRGTINHSPTHSSLPPWSTLTFRQKASRAATNTFHTGLLLLAITLTCTVAGVLYLEVLSPNSQTALFNRAADRVRSHPDCIRLLGPSREIRAFGEPSWSRWARNRRVASWDEPGGGKGMRFYVEGPKGRGTVRVSVVSARDGGGGWEWKILVLEGEGGEKVWLEGGPKEELKKGVGKMFGVKWTR